MTIGYTIIDDGIKIQLKFWRIYISTEYFNNLDENIDAGDASEGLRGREGYEEEKPNDAIEKMLEDAEAMGIAQLDINS